MITHIVFFKLAEPADETIRAAVDKLMSMKGKIPVLRHIEAGKDIVRSPRSYDIALLTKFDSMKDLDSYQIHPYHADEVSPFMKSVSSSVLSVDFES